MSTTNSLFKTNSTSLFSSNNNIDSTTISTAAPTATPNVLTTTSTATANNNISNIPPAFFIGIPKNESKTTFEPRVKETRSLSIGYGDRRLSGILSTELPTNDKRRSDTILEVPTKKINSGIANPSRGIFGDGQAIVKRSKNNANQTENSTEPTTTLKTSNTIKVFGYPTNLTINVIQHFAEYGRIERYEQAPTGNWVLITYENNASATAALKSNGVVISETYLIGVILHEAPPKTTVTQRVIPVEEATGLFKPIYKSNTAGNGLGSGKAGVSTLNNRNDQSIDGGLFSYIKESIFGW